MSALAPLYPQKLGVDSAVFIRCCFSPSLIAPLLRLFLAETELLDNQTVATKRCRRNHGWSDRCCKEGFHKTQISVAGVPKKKKKKKNRHSKTKTSPLLSGCTNLKEYFAEKDVEKTVSCLAVVDNRGGNTAPFARFGLRY